MQPKPTEAELAILHVLWKRGPSTVREVHAELGNDTGYTTVLKLMQIMTDKGLVERDVEQRAHVYRTRFGQEETQRQLTDDLLQRAFEGSAAQLMMQLLNERLEPAEIEELRRLLDEHGGSGQR